MERIRQFLQLLLTVFFLPVRGFEKFSRRRYPALSSELKKNCTGYFCNEASCPKPLTVQARQKNTYLVQK